MVKDTDELFLQYSERINGYWELFDESKKQLEEMGKLYQWFKYSEDREVRISIVNN